MTGKNGNTITHHQVANGEDLKLLTGRISAMVKQESDAYPGLKAVTGYLVEIEGQTVFLDESLMEVSK